MIIIYWFKTIFVYKIMLSLYCCQHDFSKPWQSYIDLKKTFLKIMIIIYWFKKMFTNILLFFFEPSLLTLFDSCLSRLQFYSAKWWVKRCRFNRKGPCFKNRFDSLLVKTSSSKWHFHSVPEGSYHSRQK